jgi:nucleotidyltransferase substrate binding protein (TIGR01987 family)
MEHVKKNYGVILNALKTFNEAIDLWKSDGASSGIINSNTSIKRALRDSLIQRFEYSIDICWKFMKLYMQDYQDINVEVSSPRAIVQLARESNLISRPELKLLMDAISDRNLTSHTYNEELAEEIAHRIPDHYEILSAVIKRLQIE